MIVVGGVMIRQTAYKEMHKDLILERVLLGIMESVNQEDLEMLNLFLVTLSFESIK